MKVGDLVRNTYTHSVIQPAGTFADIGVVIEAPVKGDKYPQVLVSTSAGLSSWWLAVTEVISESR